jgi:cyclopropane-fatty-acyl-phospholipid synthase
MINLATAAAERLTLPDSIMRLGINLLVGRTAARLAATPPGTDLAFAAESLNFPIATHVDDANAQHYELPAAFFALVLGPRRKYSSCFYEEHACDLETAEINALTQTCRHADLQDGQRVLELGCGWGSLSLWMAERYPASRILAVSNSASQRDYIEGEAKARGAHNLRVVTADMNAFATEDIFDRVVSVEMFEHMSNWPALLERVHGWLAPDGRVFVHVFAHRTTPYRFDPNNEADWIAQHFFTGGVMPSHGLIGHASALLEVEESWRWSGEHYRRTAEDWLANYDRHRGAIMKLLREVYGNDAPLWQRRWRLFFLATSGLFGYRHGLEWGVSHYRLRRAAAAA